MSSPIIQLDRTARVYRTGDVDVHAVRSVSLNIQRGEFVAIMGSSGSGKSTLMNILGCLDRATSGAYHLDGVNISSLNRRQLATLRNRKLGFVFQNFNLLSRTTALENVELPMFYRKPLMALRSQRQRAMQALERVGLADRLHHRPAELSGGERQRVAIARALVTQPACVLADEPTGNLDRSTANGVFELMLELARTQGTAFIVVTHDETLAARCGRQLRLVQGKLTEDGR